jgi:hypothetical protein
VAQLGRVEAEGEASGRAKKVRARRHRCTEQIERDTADSDGRQRSTGRDGGWKGWGWPGWVGRGSVEGRPDRPGCACLQPTCLACNLLALALRTCLQTQSRLQKEAGTGCGGVLTPGKNSSRCSKLRVGAHHYRRRSPPTSREEPIKRKEKIKIALDRPPSPAPPLAD